MPSIKKTIHRSGYALLGARNVIEAHVHVRRKEVVSFPILLGVSRRGAGAGWLGWHTPHAALVGLGLGALAGIAGCTGDNPDYFGGTIPPPPPGPPPPVRPQDLAQLQDLSELRDLVSPQDLAQLVDMGVPTDMAMPPDLAPYADMSVAPDLAMPPDMSMLPPPPDMSSLLDMSQRNCVMTLQGIGAADFSVHFTINTRAAVLSSVVFQRGSCGIAEDWWEVDLNPDGTLAFVVNQHANGPISTITSTKAVNDGQPHDVTISRSAGSVFINIDGALSGQGGSLHSLGLLGAVSIGVNHPCGIPDAGGQSGVCLTIP